MSCLKTHKSHIIFSLFVPVKFHRSYTLVKRIVQDYFYYITIHFHVDKVCPFEETRTLARTPRPLPSRTLRASESGKILIFHNCIFLKITSQFQFLPVDIFPRSGPATDSVNVSYRDQDQTFLRAGMHECRNRRS